MNGVPPRVKRIADRLHERPATNLIHHIKMNISDILFILPEKDDEFTMIIMVGTTSWNDA